MNRHPGIPLSVENLQPLATATGPFARRPFLSAVTALTGETVSTFGDEGTALVVVENDGEVRLAGDADLTDYHCPLGSDIKSVIALLVDTADPGIRFRFDSLPEEVATELADAFASTGLDVASRQHALAAVVDISAGYEDYLANIGKKQRHEIRRKRRRYEEEVGELVHLVDTGEGWLLDDFFRMHRMSEGEKGQFMTPAREEFFRTLIAQDGWRLDALVVPGSQSATACLFSYVDEEGFYLYNSAYDPTLRDASPGVAIIGSMIEQACAEGIPRFDFLKGDEVYKFRLGAEPRPLFEVTAKK